MTSVNLGSKIESFAVEDIEMKYENGVTVLDSVTFQIQMGSIVHIKGSPGTGKSSLMKLLAGLMRPSRGKVLVNGLELHEMSFEEFLPMRMKIGYSFDYGGLVNNKTLFENVELPLSYHKAGTPEQIQARVNSLFSFFSVEAEKFRRPSMVIGGLRKLTCILRAFANHPELLLLDEPSTGLSTNVKSRMVDWIKTYRMIKPHSTILIASTDDEFMSHFEVNTIDLDNFKVKTLKESA